MAEGGGCRDERRGSSASEVGTDDGTATKIKIKMLPSFARYDPVRLIGMIFVAQNGV